MSAHRESVDAFHERAGSWVEAHAPRRSSGGRSTVEAITTREQELEQVAAARRFQAELYAAGLSGLRWPREYGGQELTLAHEVALATAAAPFDLPTGSCSASPSGCAVRRCWRTEPRSRSVATFAKMLSGEQIWCQLFSEPAARFSPRRYPGQRGPRRRRLGCQRSEGVEFGRSLQRLRSASGPDSARTSQTPRPDDVRRRHAVGRYDGASVTPDQRG